MRVGGFNYMSVNTLSLLEQAKREVKNLNNENSFLLKDLFLGVQWKELSKNTRIQLGRLFLEYAKNNTNLLEILDKTNSNQQLYKKIIK